jgi:DNA-binding NarL/FixJ family response regulator
LHGLTRLFLYLYQASIWTQARVVLRQAITRLIPLLTIYLVEDSPVIRENLIATLEELVPVHVVGSAADEATAVRWLSEPSHRVDLVIVDIFLQAGSGLGVLRAVEALPQPGRMVVLSNFATAVMRRECLALGADRVFDKSNEIDALIAYCAALADGECTAGTPADTA